MKNRILKNLFLTALIGVVAVLLLAGCGGSSFSVVTNGDYETEVTATNADEQSGMGYVQIEKGELFTVDAAIDSDEGEFIVKIYPETEATGEEDVEEIVPSGDPTGEVTMKATGIATVDLAPGDYQIVVEGSGGVTGTLKVYGAPAE